MHSFEALTHCFDCLWPDAFSSQETFVKMPALSGALPDSAGLDIERGSDGLNLFDELLNVRLHEDHSSVMFHTQQDETSHSPKNFHTAKIGAWM